MFQIHGFVFLMSIKQEIITVHNTCCQDIIHKHNRKITGKDMPIVTQSAHIGIQKSETNSTQSTVNENIKKATRALYSLMGVGLH